MNELHTPKRWRWWHFLLITVAGGGLILATILVNLFWVRSEVRLVRNELKSTLLKNAEHKFELEVGRTSISLMRFGLSFAKLDPEITEALHIVNAVDVGVYQIGQQASKSPDVPWEKVTRALQKAGWESIVSVRHENDTVKVFTPASGGTADSTRFCVVVHHEKFLVIASLLGNAEQAMALARSKLPEFPKRLAGVSQL